MNICKENPMILNDTKLYCICPDNTFQNIEGFANPIILNKDIIGMNGFNLEKKEKYNYQAP
ncbi:MAG: hypothetical protein C0596_06200 [Marinilabiliales bacterium]|nr:MAG: hypothetical protein C0596_06200 [Marinilabiliales bacterium]